MSAYREKCLEKKGSACVICGNEKGIEVHHLDGNRTNNSIDNLVPLCSDDHSRIHAGEGPQEYVEQLPSPEADKDNLSIRLDKRTTSYIQERAVEDSVSRSVAHRRLLREGIRQEISGATEESKRRIQRLEEEVEFLREIIRRLADE